MHGQMRVIHRRGQSQIGRAQAMPLCEQSIAADKIKTGFANIAAQSLRLIDDHTRVIRTGVLLNDHCIGALRHRRTGENAHGLSGLNAPSKAMTCCTGANHGQTRWH